MMVGRFAELCRRRGLKVNAGKSKVRVLSGEKGLECEVHVDGSCNMSRNLNIWGGVLKNKMEQNAVGRWPALGGLQVLSGP